MTQKLAWEMFSPIPPPERRDPLPLRRWLRSGRDAYALPEYNVRFQSERYDKAMRHYGDVRALGWDECSDEIKRARAHVRDAMDETAKEKHRAFVLRSVC